MKPEQPPLLTRDGQVILYWSALHNSTWVMTRVNPDVEVHEGPK